jgi:asparagine synthase (glutamine-hydrolysing)
MIAKCTCSASLFPRLSSTIPSQLLIFAKHISETRSEEEMIEQVRTRLLESVRLRLRADVPVGIYLSGGLDSSVIAGMVTHLVKERGARIGNSKETERVSCFSIAFDEESGFDESGTFYCILT